MASGGISQRANRLSRPLDRDAIAEATDLLYDLHRKDPRPNPLYGADGQRLTLDPAAARHAVLRSECTELYREALARKQGQASSASDGARSEPPFGENEVSSPMQPCPAKHWINVQVRRMPDQSPRPDWWPKESNARPYAAERFSAELPRGPDTGALDGSGHLDIDDSLDGHVQMKLLEFYASIEQHLAKQLK